MIFIALRFACAGFLSGYNLRSRHELNLKFKEKWFP